MSYKFKIGGFYKDNSGTEYELVSFHEDRPATVQLRPVGEDNLVKVLAYKFRRNFSLIPMSDEEKAKNTTFKLYQEDIDMLEELASRFGGNKTVALREAIQLAYRQYTPLFVGEGDGVDNVNL